MIKCIPVPNVINSRASTSIKQACHSSKARTGAVINRFLSSWKLASHFASQINLPYFLVNSIKDSTILEKSWMNRRYYPAKPKKLRISVGFFDCFHLETASTLDGSTVMPSFLQPKLTFAKFGIQLMLS